MDQLTDDTEAARGQNTQTATGLYLRPYIRRIGTQRHCDHLDTLQPLNAEPNERKIESQEVAVLLKARFVQNPLRGYWEVDKQSSTDYTWTTIACCETFELLVQCPPGKSITLGNLDIMVILESCIEDANGDAFIRKLTSTAKCWPTGHVTFRWLLRGTTAQQGPVVKRPEVQRQKSVKQRLNPFTLLQRDPQLPGAGSTRQDRRATLPAGITASQTAPSQTRRWSSWAQRDQDDQRDDHAVGGICASQTEPSQDQRRQSWKDRVSSVFHFKRLSRGSQISAPSPSSSPSPASPPGAAPSPSPVPASSPSLAPASRSSSCDSR